MDDVNAKNWVDNFKGSYEAKTVLKPAVNQARTIGSPDISNIAVVNKFSLTRFWMERGYFREKTYER